MSENHQSMWHYEYIPGRTNGRKWRVGDAGDDMVTDYETEREALAIVAANNAAWTARFPGRLGIFDWYSFSLRNLRRCTAANGFNHVLHSWSISDWMTATLGELGEAANVLKKLNRVRDGIPGNSETPEELLDMFADELADTFIYLDLLAQAAGIDLPFAVRRKFEKTSAKIGYSDATTRPTERE